MIIKKQVLSFILVGLLLMFLFQCISIQERVPSLIRLHILANSDEAYDQDMKYRVRDKVVQAVREEFANSRSLEESRMILLNKLNVLEDLAEQELRELGCTADVKAYYGEYSFPVRYYRTFSLPAGRYEAVRLVIGEGQGANWWCVLFPPLCFVDGQTSVEGEEEEVSQKIEEALNVGKEVKIKPALKVVELWEKIKPDPSDT